MTRRTRRSVAGSVLVVLGLVVGAVIATALQAEGRERSKADTNDGGAWLLKRDVGYVGHVNRQVGEITAAVSVADPGADFDVDQAQGVIVVHDRTKGTVTVVDDSVERVANPNGVQVGSEVEAHAVDGGALIVDDASMKVWKLTREQLLSVPSTDELKPIITGEGRTLAAVTPDGNAALVDQKAGRVVFLRPDGSTAKSGKAELNDDTASVTTLGPDRAVFADIDGDLVVASAGGSATPLGIDVPGAGGQPSAVTLQQPGPPADRVVAVTTDGKVVSIPLGGGEGAEPSDIGQLGGSDPVAPISYGGCVFAISTKPATFTQWCANGTDPGTGAPAWKQIQTLPLDGAGSELRLRLVNGWVWINDVDTGAAWVTSPQQRIDRVEDWGNILSQLTNDSQDDDTNQEGGNVVTEVNPDDPTAQIVQSDEIDATGPNKPPIARDDQAETPRRPADRRRRAGQRHGSQRRRARRHRRAAGRGRRADPDRAGRAQRPGQPRRRFHRLGELRLHDHRRPRRQRLRQRQRPGRPIGGRRQPPAGRPQRHRLDPAGPADDVQRPRQRHRPRRRRARARFGRPRGSRQRGRADRARRVGRGRVHARPEHDPGADRADVHGQRRLRCHGRRHRRRVGAPAGRQQRARRPQRRRRHGGRQAGAVERARQRHRPRRRPVVHRPAADARAPDPIGRSPRSTCP